MVRRCDCWCWVGVWGLVEAIEGGFEVGAGRGEDLTDAAHREFDWWDGVSDDPIGQQRECCGSLGVRFGQRSRVAKVTAGRDGGIERDRPEEVDAELLREPFAAAFTEDGVAGAVGANGGAHVLDDASDS